MIRFAVQRSSHWKDGLENWSQLAMGAHSAVVSEAVKECFELATSTQPSVKATGSYKEGFVPIDTANLINSQRITVNGQTVAAGMGAVQAGVPEKITQRTNVSLYFDALNSRGEEYGKWVENGTRFMGGRFFVRNAKQQFRRLVDAAAARFRLK